MASCFSSVAISSMKHASHTNTSYPPLWNLLPRNEASQNWGSPGWCQITKWLIIDTFQRKMSMNRGRCERKIKLKLVFLRETSSLTMLKAFDSVDHNKLWKILKEMEMPEHLTCPLRNLYAGQEATVRTRHGTTDWFQIEKGVRQVYILSPCLFKLYAEYLMWNVGLDEAQAGIKIAWRNINYLSYADDTTLMA